MNLGLTCPQCGSSDVLSSKKRQQYICEDCQHTFQAEKQRILRRVFISYGHDEHATLAVRLKSDLVARGHEVWFDLDRLKPGYDFELYIEQGLEWVAEISGKGCIVVIMTPHSVRRPDGYCLNEITVALGRGLGIIPVMAVWCEPPLSISRIQWLDMQDCLPIDEMGERYESRFERLVDALEEGRLDFEGAQARLLRLLEPVPFDAEIAQHLNRFTGRQWVFDRINTWLADPDASRVFWITGTPGVGKTAIASWLCFHRREVAAFHLCSYGHVQKSDPRRCVMSIAYQLSTQIFDYQERLTALNLERVIPESDARTLFDNLVLQPLSGNFPSPDRTILVVMDALDEATEGGRNELATFIASELPKAPAWLRLIITSRPDPEVMQPLQGLAPYVLDTYATENEQDIRTYLTRELRSYTSGEEVPQTAVDMIVERSEGVFLYVTWIRQELAQGRLSLDRLDEFPQGLGGVFAQFFERQFSDLDAYKNKIRPGLEIILATQEPPELKMIASIFQWDDYKQKDFRDSLGSLFAIRDERIQPFHKSLRDWLVDPGRAGSYFVSEQQGHKRLAQHGWEEYQRGISEMSFYTLTHLVSHLCRTEDWSKLETILTDLKFIEVRCAKGMTYDLIADYNAALDALPEAQEEKHEKLENHERVRKYTNDLIKYSRGKIPHLDTIPSIKPWSDEKIRNDTERIINNPSRLDSIFAFALFVNSESHGLVKFASHTGFSIQQAYNTARSGPVAKAAERIVRNGEDSALLLNASSQRPRYDPHPIVLKTLDGHTNSVNAVCITPDGKRAVSGSLDGSLRVWDIETGECLSVLEGHLSSVDSTSITPDGKRAVSGSKDKTLRIWDLESGECIQTIEEYTSAIDNLTVTPDGKRAVSGNEIGILQLWDLEIGQCIRTLEGHTWRISSVCITPDGKKALSGSWDRTLRLWDTETGQCIRILEGHTERVNTVAVTADRGYAVSGSEDATLRIWNLKTGECIRTLEAQRNPIHCLDATPDGLKAISGSGGAAWRSDYSLRVWNLECGGVLNPLDRHTGMVQSMSLTPGGQLTVSGSWDKTVRVWDPVSGTCVRILEGHNYRVVCLEVTPEGKRVVSGSGDKTLRVWELDTGKCIKTLQGHSSEVSCVDITADGRLAVSGSVDKTVRIWELETGECLKALEGHTSRVNCICVTPDGEKCVSGSWDNSLRVWDLKTGECIAKLEGHKNSITALKVLSDRRQAVSGSEDNDIRIWELDTGKCIKILEGHTSEISCVDITPDGELAVSGSWDNSLLVWDLKSGKYIRRLKGHKDWINALIITPDGRQTVSGSEDKTLRLWNLESGETVAIYQAKSQIISISDIGAGNHFAFGTTMGEVIHLMYRN